MKKLLVALLALGVVATVASRGMHLDPDTPNFTISQLRRVIPDKPWQIAPNIDDRTFWDGVVKNGYSKGFNKIAKAELKKKIVPITDDEYCEFSRIGKRTTYETRWFEIQRVMMCCTMQACFTNDQKYVDKAVEALEAILAAKSWVWSAHDPKLLTFNGKEILIDLGVASMAAEVACMRQVLAPRLSEDLKKRIDDNINARLLNPMLEIARGKRQPMWWCSTKNNWNAFCFGHIVQTALMSDMDPNDRVELLCYCFKQNRLYFDGFYPDGYCTEGAGYWSYGFGNFMRMCLAVKRASHGYLNLFASKRVAVPASYPERIALTDKLMPTFADCHFGSVLPEINLAIRDFLRGEPSPYVKYMKKYRIKLTENFIQLGLAAPQLDDGVLTRDFIKWSLQEKASPKMPRFSEFPYAGVFICRPGKTGSRLNVAIKGGNNAEFHNHNDVGSYMVTVDNVHVLVDPGKMIYSRQTSNRRTRYNYRLLNSFGHNVPQIGKFLQKSGEKTDAKVVAKKLSGDKFEVTLDISAAYPDEAELTSLLRKMVYDYTGTGSVQIEDSFAVKKEQKFTTALATYGSWKNIPNGVSLTDQGKTLNIAIDTNGVPYEITETVIEEPNMEYKHPLTRLGVTLKKPRTSGTIKLTITPAEIEVDKPF